MALIKCNECGNMISDKATKCPKCGCPTTKGTESHIPQETPQVQPVYYEEEEGGRSRKWLYGIIILLVVIIAGGCYWWYSQTSDEREVKQFVEKFAKAVESGDKQTIQQLYPKSDGAESLHVSYYVDSMSIVHPTGNDTIDVKLSHSQSIRLAKDAKKQMYIVSSKGLFDFPKEEIDFAIKTGWINSSLDDAVKAERFKDKEFYKSIVNEFCSNFKKKVIQKGSLRVLKPAEFELDDWKLGITMANTTDVVISGRDYKVTMKVWDQNLYNNSLNENAAFFSITIKGKDIAPNGETLMSHSLKGTQMVKDNSVRIQWLIDDQKLFNKYFVAKGDEYEKYLESKN